MVAGFLAVGLLGAVGCGDDDSAAEDEDKSAATAGASASDGEFCSEVETLVASLDESAPALLTLGLAGFQLDSLMQSDQGIEPDRAERFGVELLEALRVTRPQLEPMVDAWQAASAAAPDEIAAEMQAAAEAAQAIPQGFDAALAEFESVTDWPAYLDSLESSEELLEPYTAAIDSEPPPDWGQATEDVVSEECGIELSDVGSGGGESAPTGGDRSASDQKPGTAEQVENLFKDEASREAVAAAFAERLGLTAQESECFLDTVDFEDLVAIESGESASATTNVVAALETCGIDAASLG